MLWQLLWSNNNNILCSRSLHPLVKIGNYIQSIGIIIASHEGGNYHKTTKINSQHIHEMALITAIIIFKCLNLNGLILCLSIYCL